MKLLIDFVNCVENDDVIVVFYYIIYNTVNLCSPMPIIHCLFMFLFLLLRFHLEKEKY